MCVQLNSIDVHSSMEQKSAGYAFSLLLPHAATEVLKLNKLTKQEIVSPSKVTIFDQLIPIPDSE